MLAVAAALTAAALPCAASAHDIPNARVERSTQVVVTPGRLRVDYEISLAELTLTQELRSFVGELPGGDRNSWFRRYGEETGPLNAKGFLVTVDGLPVDLAIEGFDLTVEEHPKFTFHLAATLPARSGVLTINDTNFATSEGTSRLAVRGESVTLSGDDLPADVSAIPARQATLLTDAEEERTRRVSVRIHEVAAVVAPKIFPLVRHATVPEPPRPASIGLTRLLDRPTGVPVALLGLIAAGLGAAHAFQPGHGKTLVAVTALADGGGWVRGAAVGVVTTLTHTGSVLAVAAALWWSGTQDFTAVNALVARGAGFVIAAIGLWRLGRVLGGYPLHDGDHILAGTHVAGLRALVGLGVAGGIVPCWDAVALVVLAAAVGRLGLGVGLVAAFGLGMGIVLVVVGYAAARLRALLPSGPQGSRCDRTLGLAGGLVLSGLGVYLLDRS